jgi:hypothetical protein
MDHLVEILLDVFTIKIKRTALYLMEGGGNTG